MYLLDTNILLYLADSSSPYHAKTMKWIKELKNPIFCFCWVSLLGFIRISTNPKIFKNPLTTEKAFSFVDLWLKMPNARILNPGDGYCEILKNTTLFGQAKGPLIMDASIAALAIEHGAKIVTADKDFLRFEEVEVVNPF